MNFDNETKEKIKELIRKRIAANGGVFDRTFKLRLKKQLTQTLEKYMPTPYELIVPYEPKEEDIKNIVHTFGLDESQISVTKNERLIGGFVLRSDSKLIDASMNGYINSLTNDIL